MQERLQHIVTQLAVPGLRNADGPGWEEAMQLMEQLIGETGHAISVQAWQNQQGRSFKNFSIFIGDPQAKRIIIGAHYDTCGETPGADDNGSAVAVLLELARMLPVGFQPATTLELVWYACEEPPFFGTEGMGSLHHATALSPEHVQLMICLEMVGYYNDTIGSQGFPLFPLRWVYGNKGNFLLIVSNWKSRSAARVLQQNLQQADPKFYRKLSLPFNIPGLDWSDHRSYWQRGIPAVMLTDTAFFRNGHYHQDSDTPSTLNYGRMAQLARDLGAFLMQGGHVR